MLQTLKFKRRSLLKKLDQNIILIMKNELDSLQIERIYI